MQTVGTGPTAPSRMGVLPLPTTKTESKSTEHTRSSGWTPLVYPASALLEGGRADGGYQNDRPTTNPYFPLHRDVLRAALRELLILDGRISKDSLKIESRSSNEATKPTSKRRLNDSITSRKRRGRKTPGDEETVAAAADENEEASIQHAEELVDLLLARSLLLPETESQDGQVVSAGRAPPMPRKVSDADSLVERPRYMQKPADILNRYESAAEISRFLDFNARMDGGSLRLKGTRIPSLLEVSIASESVLKDLSLKMTSQMLNPLDEKVVRLFFGYKSSALKTDRLGRLFAEYLFDTSHAMFAWEQTEHEIMSELGSTAAKPHDLDATIRDALFDERALRKIGGFDDSSLLRHAVSIRRLRSSGTLTSWEEFATTLEGKRLFQHHHNGEGLSVGQRRRGQRVRSRPVVAVSDSSDEERRSRASSIASVDEVSSSHVHAVKPQGSTVIDHVALPYEVGVESVTLRKREGKSWGVLLSKEGQLCVVVRAPDDLEGLKCGDIIMSVQNEQRAFVSAPEAGSDWFRQIVNLFKTTSDVLHLKIRRVTPYVCNEQDK